MSEYKQRIVFMGTPMLASYILQGLIDEGFNIVAVVTQPDKEFGRKRELRPSEVKVTANKYNIPVLTPARIRKEFSDVLAYEPDLIISSAYGQIIPKELLDYPKYKCINTHGSLLPKYRGASPIQTAIINGETKTGMSIMYMNEKMDEGDVILSKEINIDIDDTNSTLFDKMADLGLKMLLEVLPDIFKGRVNPIKQDDSLATYAPLLDKDIEKISFNDDVLKVYNHIRGLLDNPGCHFVIDAKKYKIEKASFAYSDDVLCNVFRGFENDYLRIDCNNGFIKIYTIKPEGKNSMDGKSFFNGAGRNLVGKQIG